MNESPDVAAKRAWQESPGGGPTDSAAIRAGFERRLAEQRRRALRFWGSAAIIAPSWLVAWWWLPDLRPLATVGFAVAVWLMVQMYRRTPARQIHAGAELPCVAHQREWLARERNFHQSMPRWYLVPIVIGQVAIVATLLLNSRFVKNALFDASLSLFIVTVAGVLVMALRRARRIVAEIDRELIALKQEVV